MDSKPAAGETPAPTTPAAHNPQAVSSTAPAGAALTRSVPGPRGPGEPYTPMPDFSKPGRPAWLYMAVTAVLALALALGMLYARGQRAAGAQAAPVSQSVIIGAPSAAPEGQPGK
jgi:hypothetical protein